MNLKEARLEKGLRALDLAELCQTTNVTISLLENNKFKPSHRIRRRIEQILGPVVWDENQ